MRLHHFQFAPNPRKVRVYLAEKGITVPLVAVDLMQGEQRAPAFLAKNPLGSLPVLELDDGSYLTESLAIIEYLEELHPEPPMLGRTPLERARVRELERLVETTVLNRIARIFFNTNPVFRHAPQLPAAAAQAREGLPRALAVVDARVDAGPFAAGAAPTIADCTLFAAFEHAKLAGETIPPAYANLWRWYERFAARPSAQA
jgi:glutathione S-transferase